MTGLPCAISEAMRLPFYITQLKRDLAFWAREGLIAQERIPAMLDALVRRDSAAESPGRIFTAAGALLLLLGILITVSVNWDAIPRLVRLATLSATFIALFAAGTGALLISAQRWIAELCFFLAAGVFGASIFLIAQMYNIDTGNVADAVMLWAAGALATAWASGQKSPLGLAFVVATIWLVAKLGSDYGGSESGSFYPPMLLFLLPWTAGLATTLLWSWRRGLHLAATSFIFFLASLLVTIPALDGKEKFAVFGLAALSLIPATFLLAGLHENKGRPGWLAAAAPALLRYGIFLTLPSYAAIHFVTGEKAQLLQEGSDSPGALVPLALACVPLLLLLAAAHLRRLRRLDAAALLIPVCFFAVCGLAILSAAPSAFFWLSATGLLLFSLWLIDLGARLYDPVLRYLGYIFFIAEALFLYLRAFGSLLETGLALMLGGLLLIALGAGLYTFAARTTARYQKPTP